MCLWTPWMPPVESRSSAKHGQQTAATAFIFSYLPQSITLSPPAYITISLLSCCYVCYLVMLWTVNIRQHQWQWAVSRQLSWNDRGNGKPKYSARNLYQCHFVHHSSLMDWTGIEPGTPWWGASDQRPQPRYSPTSSTCSYLVIHVTLMLKAITMWLSQVTSILDMFM